MASVENIGATPIEAELALNVTKKPAPKPLCEIIINSLTNNFPEVAPSQPHPFMSVNRRRK